MAEVKTAPIEGRDEHGETWTFTEAHSLADIARWVMRNRSEAEEVHRMLGEMLEDEPAPAIH